MTENLIKRFLLEKAYENGMEIPVLGEIPLANTLYGKFKNGEIIIDELEFEIWLENLKRNKRSFGTYLKSIGYLKRGMEITEITDDQSVSLINNICLDVNKNIILSQSGEGYYGRPSRQLIKGHLVINGVYDNQKIYLAKLLRNKSNSFTIGYYGQDNSEYTRRVIEYYNQLRDKFLNKSVEEGSIDVVEDTIFNGDKIYVLSYQVHPYVHKFEPVKTRHSER